MHFRRLPDVIAPDIPTPTPTDPAPTPAMPGADEPVASILEMLVNTLLVTALIGLVEAVVLTLLQWGDFRRSLGAALLMNIVSSALGVVLKLLFDVNFLSGVAPFMVAYLLSVVVEYGVLTRFKRDAARQNLVAALAANAVSYALIGSSVVLPALFNQ